MEEQNAISLGGSSLRDESIPGTLWN
jgi:hypothetical protein